MTTPRIYVTCLTSYNNGILHGEWIDVDENTEENIQEMLEKSTFSDAEEWAIHDYEGFGNVRIGENHDLEKLQEIAEMISEDEDLAMMCLEYHDGDTEEAKEMMENYRGCYKSLGDWKEEEMIEMGIDSEIPESVKGYIDYDRMAKDDELNSYILSIETGFEEVHVFSR